MKRKLGSIAVAVGLLLAVAVAAPVASADDYRSNDAGHPVRIVSYVLHPIGVLVDYVLLRPAHWLVTHQPLKTIFGHED